MIIDNTAYAKNFLTQPTNLTNRLHARRSGGGGGDVTSGCCPIKGPRSDILILSILKNFLLPEQHIYILCIQSSCRRTNVLICHQPGNIHSLHLWRKKWKFCFFLFVAVVATVTVSVSNDNCSAALYNTATGMMKHQTWWNIRGFYVLHLRLLDPRR